MVAILILAQIAAAGENPEASDGKGKSITSSLMPGGFPVAAARRLT